MMIPMQDNQSLPAGQEIFTAGQVGPSSDWGGGMRREDWAKEAKIDRSRKEGDEGSEGE